MFTTDIFCLFVLISLILDLLGGRLVGYIVMFFSNEKLKCIKRQGVNGS